MRWACWTLHKIQTVINRNPLHTESLHMCALWPLIEPDSTKALGTQENKINTASYPHGACGYCKKDVTIFLWVKKAKVGTENRSRCGVSEPSIQNKKQGLVM